MWYQIITLLTALLLSTAALSAGLRSRRRMDWMYFGATLPFACLAGLELLALNGWLGGQKFVLATRVTYQLIILGVTAFLMASLRGGAWPIDC